MGGYGSLYSRVYIDPDSPDFKGPSGVILSQSLTIVLRNLVILATILVFGPDIVSLASLD